MTASTRISLPCASSHPGPPAARWESVSAWQRRGCPARWRVARVHPAVGPRAVRVRPRRGNVRGRPGRGLAARIEGRRGGRRGPGGMGMAKNLCLDAPRFMLAVAAAEIALARPSAAGQISAIASGGDRRVSGPQAQVRRAARGADHSAKPGHGCIGPHAVLSGARNAARYGRDLSEPCAGAARCFLPGRIAGVWGRTRRPAAASGRGCSARMGIERCVPRRLRCGAGRSGAALHVCRLSRRGHGPGAERLARCAALHRGDLPAGLSPHDRRAAVLGRVAADDGSPFGPDGSERCRGRSAARRTLQASVDQRDPGARRFRAGAGRICTSGILEAAAMAGRAPERSRRLESRKFAL